MPIQQTGAKLWFDTKEEEQEYDDLMISNIELKSTDYDDENFSPVFSRKTQESFIGVSDRALKDVQKLLQPYRSASFDDFIDKHELVKPNHSFWRHWPIEKLTLSYAAGYLALRELPLRNFYARCLVMLFFTAKAMDIMRSPIPWFGPQGEVIMAPDRFFLWDVKNYDNVRQAVWRMEIPSVGGDVRESFKWYGRQPAHLQRSDFYNFADYITRLGGKSEKKAHWDGTMNQPLHRLADPRHKDCSSILFQ